MKAKTLVYFLLALFLAGCERVDIPNDVPKCIVHKIKYLANDAKKHDSIKNGASVREYLFQGHSVYTIFYGGSYSNNETYIIDSLCNHLGLISNSSADNDINGESFDHATLVRILYEN